MEDKVFGEENPVKVLLKNLILSFLVSIILMLILSVLLSTTNLEEKIISSAIICISSFSIMLGGFFSSKKLKLKGIIVRNVTRNCIYGNSIFNFKYCFFKFFFGKREYNNDSCSECFLV